MLSTYKEEKKIHAKIDENVNRDLRLKSIKA
jgi:hypothetical protein